MIRALYHYAALMRLHRPVGIWLLLWPTLMALWLAGTGHPSMKLILLFVLGTILMRSAGCVVNDLADRKFDGHVARTKQRPLVTGAVSVRGAILLLCILLLLAFAVVLCLNRETVLLSLIAFGLTLIYPLMKRYTYYPQAVLGAAFAMAIPMAYTAQEQPLSWSCWGWYVAALLWTWAYDTQYAMADRADDQKIGVKSMAIALGRYDKAGILIMQCLSIGLWGFLGNYLGLGSAFFVGLLVVCGLVGYQQWLISKRESNACFRAFVNNQWAVLIMFVGVVLGLG